MRMCIKLKEELLSMAKQAHPNEFFALLVQEEGIIKKYYIINVRAHKHSVFFREWDVPITPNIVGTIHSHPNGIARPSRQDLETFARFGDLHGITGWPYNTIEFYNVNGEHKNVEFISC